MSGADSSASAAGGTPTDGQPDPVLGALLGSIGEGGKIDPMSLLMSQVTGGVADDPRTALLLRLFDQWRSAPAEETSAEDDETRALAAQDAADRRARAREECARRIRELRTTLRKAYAELEKLRARNDTLAAALGACHLCFGADPLCPECGGNGVPGSLAPEPAAWRELVVPAVQRVRTIRALRDGRASRRGDPPGATMPHWPVPTSATIAESELAP